MYRLHKTSFQDLNAIAECHSACFDKSLQVKLGESYVAKSFEWFLNADNRFLHHIYDDKKIIAYCGGFISKYVGDGSSSGMMQHAMKQGIANMIRKPWLLFHPELMKFYPFILKNLYKKLFKRPGNDLKNVVYKSGSEQKVGLVVIGVHPAYRGKGIFEELIKNFECEAQKRNINKLSLSVKANNDRAVNAYKKTGWIINKETKKSFEMIKML